MALCVSEGTRVCVFAERGSDLAPGAAFRPPSLSLSPTGLPLPGPVTKCTLPHVVACGRRVSQIDLGSNLPSPRLERTGAAWGN